MSFFENINKISLSFPKEMEKGFRDYFFEKSIKILRIELLFVIFLYAIFGVLDTILVPEQKYLFFQIRYLVVIPILFVALLLSYLKGFKKIKEYVLGITYIFVGSGIIVMIITLPNNYMYYLGLMLVFAGTYFISNLKFTTASIVSWINVIIFNFCYIN
jgi:hypothetical protein